MPRHVALAALDAVGAATVADRHANRRTDDDVLTIPVPPPDDAIRTRRVRMRRMGGADMVVRLISDGGWRSFEAPLPDVVLSVLREWPDQVFDVGANTGFYSLVAAAAAPDIRVHGFEPVPDIADIARENFSLNWPTSRRIDLHQVAVSDRAGTMQLHIPAPQADGTIETSASLDSSFKDAHHRSIDVEVVTLDMAWQRAGMPATSLVKIDVEGAEHLVLAGAAEMIGACRPIVAVEILARADTAPFEYLCANADYVAVTLSPWEAVVNPPSITPVDVAPNQLLVPWERLGPLVERLRDRRDFVVTLLD